MNAPIRQNAGLQFIHLRGRRMYRAWQDEFDPEVEIVHSIRLADLLCNAAKLNERSEVIRNKLRITRSKLSEKSKLGLFLDMIIVWRIDQEIFSHLQQ